MQQRATGTFDVQLTPQPPDARPEATFLSRLTITKQFHGDLAATSAGQMLAAMTDVDGSASYVAIERAAGALHGRSGSFILQHYGISDRGSQQLTLAVVPDSGTGDLSGLSGTMAIHIADGLHTYTFDYALSG